MIKWKRNDRKINIDDIEKVIDILPCSWVDGKLKPYADGENLIYAVSDNSDGYIVIYYKCSIDGTILKIGFEVDEDW